MYVEAGQPFEAVYAHGLAGLVPGIEVAVFDGDGNITIGPTSADITEEMVGLTPTGVYTWNAPAAPLVIGQYTIIWSPDGTWDALTNSTADELVVVALGADTLPPLPAPVGGGIGPGPCTAWTTSLAIAVCNGVPNSNAYDDSIAAASEILYELSAHRFPGTCERTVRPCATAGVWCGLQILSRGYVIQPWNWTGASWGFDCGCNPLSYVELVGKPVTAITEVKIDGAVIPDTDYRLDSQQFLVSLNGLWPACQDLTLPDTEAGTWSVTYQHGQAIPMAGQMAARDLAWEIYKSCSSTDTEGECALPEGVTRVTRQGISYEMPAFESWGRDFSGTWRTGLRLVDAFLNAYNPKGLQRRPILYVPGATKQARKVGT